MKRRDLFAFFANPFVVLADVMVSLVFIISLFLLATTVYSEQMAQIAKRDARRRSMSEDLGRELQRAGFISNQEPQGNELKYRLGKVLEVEDDGSIQRFRFLSGLLDYKFNSTALVSPQNTIDVLRVFGRVLLQNRSHIKSIVIEGHAEPGEQDAWQLSQSRAETIRAYWEEIQLTAPVAEDWKAPVFKFMAARHLWDARRFHEWHLQEYQARRVKANRGLGVLPAAWIISSGRGDQVRRRRVVEFKVEYTERDAPPLDEYLSGLGPKTRDEARQANLIATLVKTP